MSKRMIVLASFLVLVGASAAWSAARLTPDQAELCGEDAARFCPDNVANARSCLVRRVKEVAPSCGYLLRRKDTR
jgi:hypothetical protein